MDKKITLEEFLKGTNPEGATTGKGQIYYPKIKDKKRKLIVTPDLEIITDEPDFCLEELEGL